MKFIIRRFAIKRTLAIVLPLASALAASDDLPRGFGSPPISARPWVYWFWMNGNISREGLTKDLEEMRKTGLGGALIANVTVNIPPGPVVFNSPEWHALMTHAVNEAGRLGLELGTYTGAGWAQSGGPWVKPEHSVQMLTWSETFVPGSVHFSGQLPRPAATRRNPENLELIPAEPFYRDVAVFARRLPSPEAKPMRAHQPKITASAAAFDRAVLMDGDHETGVVLSRGGAGQPVWVQIEFSESFTARGLGIRMMGRSSTKRPRGELQVSADGKRFIRVSEVVIPDNGPLPSMASILFPATKGRVFRLELTNLERDDIGVSEIELYASARIPDWGMKAGFIRGKSPAKGDWKLAVGEAVGRDDLVNLTGKMSAHGRIEWDVPEGAWIILRIGHTSTGATCRPSPAGGKGLEVDKFSQEALEDFWAGHMAKIVSASAPLAGKALTMVHTDSWETGAQNWTPKFREEFQRRRGYDPLPYLPAMLGVPIESVEVSERFLWDVRRTISDLFADNYYGHLRVLAQRHGMTLSGEPYGATGNFEEFQLGSRSDIPMATFWTHTPVEIMPVEVVEDDPRSGKLAASIAHTGGKKFVGAESFTARPNAGDTAGWQDHPYSLKALGDVVGFASGVNRLVIASYTHQPWPTARPGMTMGRTGIHFDWPITWWEQARAWTAYLSRCQWLLQQGLFVADVCGFTGEDAPNYSPSPRLPAGYDWDVCNAEVILGRMSVRNGRLVLPDGMSYRYLELPNQSTMTPRVLRKIKDLVAAGATVVGPKPVASPSLTGHPACDDEVRKLAGDVWSLCDGRTVKEDAYGRGRLIWGRTWTEIFAADNLPPDFSFLAKDKNARIHSIHRSAAGLDIYFVANAKDRAEETICTFRVSGKVPEFWHPDTGHIQQAAFWRERNGCTEVPVPLDPRGSVFVVFRAGHAVAITALAHDGRKVYPELALGAGVTPRIAVVKSAATLIASEPGEYEVEFSTGKKTTVKVEAIPPSLPIRGEWKVSFPPGLGAPETARFDKLISWPEHANPGIKYFSGTATYTNEIDVPAALARNDIALTLDLGRVEVIAELTVNGKDFGVLWKPPFAADITDAIRPGRNLLTVKVVNLWPNRLIGDEQLPTDVTWTKGGAIAGWPEWLSSGQPRPSRERVTFTTWQHWKKAHKLRPSGLLGPVTLRAARCVAVR